MAPTPASTNMSLVIEGTDQSLEDMIKSTRRGLIVTFFWYIRRSTRAPCSTPG